ncbi:hypothetical protein FNV43_RR12748 [Rhamnella rubrinervis]|uniref:GPI inositol-deacylase n=1 Tax=Rhamnella rubrinervis TaxID=2594499 RepID=A0A8K0MIS5_9ROSA|nr:hypothetical protein FNV43_RR12748 [Rhamnella rubrinervis]
MASVLSQIKPAYSAFSQDPSPSSSPSSSSSVFKYRPAVILPGLGNNSSDYHKLELTLRQYGVETVVAKVSRFDWLRNAAGLVDPNYWRGTLRPRPVLDWYLKKVDEAVREAKDLTQGGTLSLIGHSAGGWLARIYMEDIGLSHISLLLTLGTPHLPPPKGLPGVIDQTRGLLNYVQKNCSKAVYTSDLKYVCIAGRYIQGARFFASSNVNVDGAPRPIDSVQPISNAAIINNLSIPTSTTTFRARIVGQGYKQVCGLADVWGDGVVPELSAHLDGALNLSLDGVYHSPVGSDDDLRPWEYISRPNVDSPVVAKPLFP